MHLEAKGIKIATGTIVDATILYLYTLDQQTRQMLGSMWNIKLSQPSLIGTRARKD